MDIVFLIKVTLYYSLESLYALIGYAWIVGLHLQSSAYGILIEVDLDAFIQLVVILWTFNTFMQTCQDQYVALYGLVTSLTLHHFS